MGTVSKALGLLDFLKSTDTQLGLTELAKLAGFDKATTRRLLLELMANGFVEQDEIDKYYVLGPALVMLGKAREERFPLYKTVLPIIKNLAEETGETVHAAEYGAGMLISICIQESEKANRVSLDAAQKLPLHATASGIAYLAHCSSAYVEQFLRKPRSRFTKTTPLTNEEILKLLAVTRSRGFSTSNQTLEDGVHSVATAFVDARGKPIGTVAIAMPSSRTTASTIDKFGALVKLAAIEISAKLFGRPIGLRKIS